MHCALPMFTTSLPPFRGFRSRMTPGGAPCEQSLLLFSWSALPESCQTFEVAAAQTSGPVNLVSSCQTGFFECKYLFFEEPMLIPEITVASEWLLGLGSKLYPSDMQRMLNKDLTQFVQSLSSKIDQVKERLCWQGAQGVNPSAN